MTNDSVIEVEGRVTMNYPGSQFEVELSTEGFEGHKLRARLSGKMRMNYIRIVPGDRVKIELSPYNLEEGRIVFRFKDTKPHKPHESRRISEISQTQGGLSNRPTQGENLRHQQKS